MLEQNLYSHETSVYRSIPIPNLKKKNETSPSNINLNFYIAPRSRCTVRVTAFRRPRSDQPLINLEEFVHEHMYIHTYTCVMA